MVREECSDCPDGCEHGHDEEDENVVGRERIVTGVDVDEVGQHAEGWNL